MSNNAKTSEHANTFVVQMVSEDSPRATVTTHEMEHTLRAAPDKLISVCSRVALNSALSNAEARYKTSRANVNCDNPALIDAEIKKLDGLLSAARESLMKAMKENDESRKNSLAVLYSPGLSFSLKMLIADSRLASIYKTSSMAQASAQSTFLEAVESAVNAFDKTVQNIDSTAAQTLGAINHEFVSHFRRICDKWQRLNTIP